MYVPSTAGTQDLSNWIMLSWGNELGRKDASRLVESWISRRIGGLLLMHLLGRL